MDIALENEALTSILEYTVPRIRKDVRYWMIRSQGGNFYEEFIREQYIGFGWNVIEKKSNFGDEKALNNELHKTYDIDRAGWALNKCKCFINEIKENDIVLIPNRGSTEIAIALLGEYYEDTSWTIDDEKDVLWKIKNRDRLLRDVRCPFKKRRKITVLRIVSGNSLNPHLYKTIRNYSAIDDIDEHAEYILSMLFDTFIYDGNLHIVLNVGQTKDIELRDLSGVLYGSASYFSRYVDKNKVTAKVNVCSEGQIFIVLREILEYIDTYGAAFVAMFLTFFGGTYGIIKLKEFPKFLKGIVTIKESFLQAKIDTKIKDENLREKRLQNDILEIEVNQKKPN